jgi:hypothetical protein
MNGQRVRPVYVAVDPGSLPDAVFRRPKEGYGSFCGHCWHENPTIGSIEPHKAGHCDKCNCGESDLIHSAPGHSLARPLHGRICGPLPTNR